MTGRSTLVTQLESPHGYGSPSATDRQRFLCLLRTAWRCHPAGSRAGRLRQTLYRESQQTVTVLEGAAHQAEIAQLQQQIAELEREQEQARAAAEQRHALTVTIDRDKQAEFASVGQAEGVSLPCLRNLLRVLLAKSAPSVATLGRLTQAAGQRARELLPVLDAISRPLVRQALTDEIFVGRKPVLMVVEPDSLCWVNGRLAPNRSGNEWAKDLRRLTALEQMTCDQGTGMGNARKQINEEREQNQQALVALQVDQFHLFREAKKALRRQKHEAAKAIKKAEAAQQKLAQREWHGKKCTVQKTQVQRWWRLAEEAMDRWSANERAWDRLQKGFGLFTATGELNSRARVQALIAEVEPQLTGTYWDKVRRLLATPETCTFLDRAHQQLAELSLEPEVREAVIEAEGLRRRPELAKGEGTKPAAMRGILLVMGVLMSQLGAAGTQAAAAVQQVLKRTCRASSLVEGVNSVIRMHQARHRRLTQEMLDLKRLYWNCRTFRTGPRRGQSPYERLGVSLPEISWWDMLKLSPEQLRERLSAAGIAG